jgi:hypothetical protein
MKWLTKARSLNGIAAVVVVLAWLAGTNHCLLGLRHQPKSKTVSTCTCPNHSEKSDGAARGSSTVLGCCQGLQSPKIDLAKAKIEPVLVGLHLLQTAHFTLPEAPRNILQNTEYDTGPPATVFFVDTVLQRCPRERSSYCVLRTASCPLSRVIPSSAHTQARWVL